METLSALLALCAGNSPVTGVFPKQRLVTQSFDALFDLCLNKRLSKQSWGWWFETPSRSLFFVIVMKPKTTPIMNNDMNDSNKQRKHATQPEEDHNVPSKTAKKDHTDRLITNQNSESTDFTETRGVRHQFFSCKEKPDPATNYETDTIDMARGKTGTHHNLIRDSATFSQRSAIQGSRL